MTRTVYPLSRITPAGFLLVLVSDQEDRAEAGERELLLIGSLRLGRSIVNDTRSLTRCTKEIIK